MGMQFHLEQITGAQVNEFIKNPRAAYEYYMDDAEQEAGDALEQMAAMAANEDLSPEQRAHAAEAHAQFQALLSSFGRPARKGPALVRQKRRKFSLEKDWHILHYVLNGTHEGGEGSLADAILGGRILPDHDQVMGYGPLRCLDPEQVKAVAHALGNVDPQSLTSRLDRRDAEAKQIYLAHTLDDLSDWSYLPDLFKGFRAFYDDAARRENGMLLSIS